MVKLPAGLAGNPQAYPRCTSSYLIGSDQFDCPADTQVGVATLKLLVGGQLITASMIPVYNMVPQNHNVAEFALRATFITVHIVLCGLVKTME